MNGLRYAEFRKCNEDSGQTNRMVYVIDLKVARVFVSEIHTDGKHTSEEDIRNPRTSTEFQSASTEHNNNKNPHKITTLSKTLMYVYESQSLFNNIIHFLCTNTFHTKTTPTLHADSSRQTDRTVTHKSLHHATTYLQSGTSFSTACTNYPVRPTSQPHTTHILLSLLSPNISPSFN
jgi:hypothetical protein